MNLIYFKLHCRFLISFLLFLTLFRNASTFVTDFQKLGSTYDFVIVGGGTAGCAVASRLSHNGKYTVLLLESGGVPEPFLEIPGLALENQEREDVTVHYESIPQKNAGLALNNGVIRATAGKVVGGTSQINFSIFNRGSPLDFDNWANFTKDQSWNYANMLEYFKKSEAYLGEFPSLAHHGFQGPIPVSFQSFAPGRDVWQEAGRELGFEIRDPNGPQKISFGPMEFSLLNGRRHSSYRGYLEPVVGSRANLRIITRAHVTKVIFDKEGKTAIGVKYTLNTTSEEIEAFARKEVVLSAGALGSPTLLMKSGVGPREVLKSARIPLVKELPVGENFQDHPIVSVHIILNNKSLSYDPEDKNTETFELWRNFGIGPYATVIGYAGQAFLASSVAQKEGEGDWADIHVRLATTSALFEPFQGNYIAPWETSIRINLVLGRQKSRGTVKLSPDGTSPLIDYKFLEDKRDEDIFLDAIGATLKIFEGTKTYQRYGARIFNEPLHSCAHLKFRSEEYWRCYIRSVTITGNHPLGTCSMGLVVDSRLKVNGIKGLRVVDASVMPFAPNSNIHAVVYAVAEKASDLILKEYENKIDLLKKYNFEIGPRRWG